MTPPDPHLWVVILAGGVGSRFWPVSTGARPKQLLPLVTAQPLVADTIERALGFVPQERIRVLAGRDLESALTTALPDVPGETYLWEPVARGTAPALTWASWAVASEDPEAVLISLHSDHLVEPVDMFHADLHRCASAARAEGVLMTIGVSPDGPDPGYGYVQPGPALGGNGDGPAFRVERFHEKPDVATAEEYLREGYLWNSGIFVWEASLFLDELRAHTPEIASLLPLLEAGDVDGFFHAVPEASVDEAVLERSARVATVEATFRWDDVGTWEALTRTREVDENGNVTVGDALLVESERNIVYTEDAPVALFGVEDIVVIRTAGMTMVTTRERSRDLKRLVERLPPEWRAPGS